MNLPQNPVVTEEYKREFNHRLAAFLLLTSVLLPSAACSAATILSDGGGPVFVAPPLVTMVNGTPVPNGSRIPAGSRPTEIRTSSAKFTSFVTPPRPADPNVPRIRDKNGRLINEPPGATGPPRQEKDGVHVPYGRGELVIPDATLITAGMPNPPEPPPVGAHLEGEMPGSLSPAEALAIFTEFISDPYIPMLFGRPITLVDIDYNFAGTTPLPVNFGATAFVFDDGTRTDLVVIPEPGAIVLFTTALVGVRLTKRQLRIGGI